VIGVRRTSSAHRKRLREDLIRGDFETDLLDRFLEHGEVVANVVPARDASGRVAQKTPNQLVGHAGCAEPRRERVPRPVLVGEVLDPVLRRAAGDLEISTEPIGVARPLQLALPTREDEVGGLRVAAHKARPSASLPRA